MTAPLKAQSFADLKPLRRTLQERAALQAERERLRREAEQRARAERHLFQDAVGAVQPLKGQHERHWPAPVPPEPLPVQRQLDEARVLHESLSDEFDVSTLLDVDDQLSFRRTGMGPDVTRRLRAGQFGQRQAALRVSHPRGRSGHGNRPCTGHLRIEQRQRDAMDAGLKGRIGFGMAHAGGRSRA